MCRKVCDDPDRFDKKTCTFEVEALRVSAQECKVQAVKNYHTAHKKDVDFYEQVIYAGSLSQPMPLTEENEKKLQRAIDDAVVAETRQRSVGE